MIANCTPGPWVRSGVRTKLGIEDCIRVGPSGCPIIFIPIGKTQNEHASAIADADLSSAAPDMLQALEYLVATTVPQTSQQTECWKAIHKAIAKAKGKLNEPK